MGRLEDKQRGCEGQRTFLWISPNFLAPGTSFMKGDFSHHLEKGGWFQNDSSALHLLCTLFLLLHQLHLRSSGIRSRRLGTPLSALSPGHGYQVTEASCLFACRYLEPSNKRIIPQKRNVLKETVSNLCILLWVGDVFYYYEVWVSRVPDSPLNSSTASS